MQIRGFVRLREAMKRLVASWCFLLIGRRKLQATESGAFTHGAAPGWGCGTEVGQHMLDRSELINSAQRFQGWTISCAFLICRCLIPQPST
jgi:hypothetical protein